MRNYDTSTTSMHVILSKGYEWYRFRSRPEVSAIYIPLIAMERLSFCSFRTNARQVCDPVYHFRSIT